MPENKPKLLILAGPTATGKTKLSIQLGKELSGEIISADSMQVYRGMDIGTAKVTAEEMEGVPHHLLDIIDPKDPWNVMLFQQEAKKKIKEIQERNHLPILVGGTGFYIQSVLYDIHFTENKDDFTYRESLEKLAEEKGPEVLFEMLSNVDPESTKIIHPNNVKRVIRALEFYKETGMKISEHNETEHHRESPYDFRFYCLYRDREELYKRIELRVDQMMEAGLVSEVKKLQKQGLSRNDVSMQGLGYKEILDYLDSKCTLEEAVDIIKKETRHFAKRQMTWFRREKEITFVNLSHEDFWEVYERNPLCTRN